jgi:DNA-binding MarR family transcriptional regulator
MTTTGPAATLNPSVVGQAEKAHSAILYRALAGTTVDEKQWITLSLAVADGGAIGRTELVTRVAGAAKFDSSLVQMAVEALIRAGLVENRPEGGEQFTVTDAGRALVENVRATTNTVVARAYRDIPPDDLATAARVLTVITARLTDELAER